MKYMTLICLFASAVHAEEIHWPATISDIPESKIHLSEPAITTLKDGKCNVVAILQQCKSKRLLAYEQKLKDPKTIALMKKYYDDKRKLAQLNLSKKLALHTSVKNRV